MSEVKSSGQLLFETTQAMDWGTTPAAINREIFLRDHRDLISPWAFSKLERRARAAARLLDGWQIAKRLPNPLTGDTV